MVSVLWLLSCLFLPYRLRSISSKVHPEPNSNFNTFSYFKIRPNQQIFNHSEPVCFAYPQNLTQQMLPSNRTGPCSNRPQTTALCSKKLSDPKMPRTVLLMDITQIDIQALFLIPLCPRIHSSSSPSRCPPPLTINLWI